MWPYLCEIAIIRLRQKHHHSDLDKYYSSDEFREVLHQYESILQEGDGFLDADDYADVAEFYLAKGDERKAREALERGTSIFPDALPPLAVLARIELDANHIDKAEKLLERVTDKDAPEYQYVQAEIMIAKGHVQEAEQFLSELEIDDEPDEVALDIAAIYIDHNEFQLARKWLDKVKDRNLPDVQDFEAHILTGEGRYDEGEKVVNDMLDEDPYSAEHWNHLASVQYQKADYNASIESSEFALAIDSTNAEAILNKANAFYALQRYKEACQFYEQFLSVRPDNITAQYFYGASLALLGKHKEATKVLKATLQHVVDGCKDNDTTSIELLPDILHELAYELMETGDYKEAQHSLRQAQTMLKDQNGIEEIQAELHLVIAKIYLLQADIDHALEHFDAARDVCNTPSTFVRTTAVIYECGYTEKAFEILSAQLFSEDARDWTTGHAYLARYAYALGRLDIYKLLLAIAVERNPAEAQMVLYDLYPAGTKPEDYPFTHISKPTEDEDNNNQ